MSRNSAHGTVIFGFTAQTDLEALANVFGKEKLQFVEAAYAGDRVIPLPLTYEQAVESTARLEESRQDHEDSPEAAQRDLCILFAQVALDSQQMKHWETPNGLQQFLDELNDS